VKDGFAETTHQHNTRYSLDRVASTHRLQRPSSSISSLLIGLLGNPRASPFSIYPLRFAFFFFLFFYLIFLFFFKLTANRYNNNPLQFLQNLYILILSTVREFSVVHLHSYSIQLKFPVFLSTHSLLQYSFLYVF